MSLQLRTLDALSLPAGKVNDDRVGSAGAFAWALDGATDVLAEPLMPGGSDAAWIAALLDDELRKAAASDVGSLSNLVPILTEASARRFAAERRRPPEHPHEQPSAAGLIVRLDDETIEYLSLADCQCLLKNLGAPTLSIGRDPEITRGDQRTAESMSSIRLAAAVGWAEARAQVWPRIRAARDRLNTAEGYGVLSVIPPPAKFVRTGRVAVTAGARLLLATDGFMRLVDLFGRYGADEMVRLAGESGLAALARELREIETADGDCLRVPRTKPHDDASAILLEIVA
jgi:hypothetical protein